MPITWHQGFSLISIVGDSIHGNRFISRVVTERARIPPCFIQATLAFTSSGRGIYGNNRGSSVGRFIMRLLTVLCAMFAALVLLYVVQRLAPFEFYPSGQKVVVSKADIPQSLTWEEAQRHIEAARDKARRLSSDTSVRERYHEALLARNGLIFVGSSLIPFVLLGFLSRTRFLVLLASVATLSTVVTVILLPTIATLVSPSIWLIIGYKLGTVRRSRATQEGK